MYELFFQNYTLRMVALGSATLGIVSGALGSFAVLRRQSLLGDAVSHAALPGIALAYMLTGSKTPLVLILGAAVAGWVGTLLVLGIVRMTRVKEDSALGLILSAFFGLGLVLLTILKRLPDAGKAGLDHFLLGQAATLKGRDVETIALLGGIALLVIVIFWKEFKLLAFDADFGASVGFPMRLLEILLTGLIVIAIVIGLNTVGVVLMSAMLIAPAASARQWTDRLGVMVLLAGLFGALAGTAGAVISSVVEKLPTGPMIVLCLGVVVVVSILGAPNRGLVWNWFRARARRRQLQLEAVLEDLYALSRHHEGQEHSHPVAVLRAMSFEPESVPASLEELASRGWARKLSRDQWTLTPEGAAEARRQEESHGTVSS